MTQFPPHQVLLVKALMFSILGIGFVVLAMSTVGMGRLVLGLFGLGDIAYALYLTYKGRQLMRRP